jgi:hypothetical protein
MNRAGKIALGCLLAPIGVLVLIVVFFSAIRMTGVPEPRVTQRSLEQDLATTDTGETVLERRGETDTGRQTGLTPERPEPTRLDHMGADPVQVVIDLDEGYFTIAPGPADEGIRVEADYDEATYELTQNYSLDREGRPTYLLRLKSRVSFLRRLAQDGGFEDDDLANTVEVQLPVDTPMALYLSLAKAEAEVDLTGLALENAATRFRMGEFKLMVDEDNPIEMKDFVNDSSMGEMRLHGLSRLRAERLELNGSMGEFVVDLEGGLTRDTEIKIGMKMGEMTLRLPENAVWDPHSNVKASLGEIEGSLDHPGNPDPEVDPVLRVNGSVFMGGMIIDSYRVRSGLRDRSRRRH